MGISTGIYSSVFGKHMLLLMFTFLLGLQNQNFKSFLVSATIETACVFHGGKSRLVFGKERTVRIRYFHVPTPLLAGESALLSCHYELEGNETLYAVKWYKDMAEFFRYIPASSYKFKMIKQPGIDVDESKSNEKQVFLRNMGLESLGNYTCQVSTDEPYFRCVQTTRFLDVVVPPSDGPVLLMEPEKTEFELGENVSILCNSGRGKPAPHLTWYINGRPFYSNNDEQEIVRYPDNMESSSLVLRFHLKPDVFKEGKVVLKCVASLHRQQAAVTREIITGTSSSSSHRHYVWLVTLSPFMFHIRSYTLPV